MAKKETVEVVFEFSDDGSVNVKKLSDAYDKAGKSAKGAKEETSKLNAATVMLGNMASDVAMGGLRRLQDAAINLARVAFIDSTKAALEMEHSLGSLAKTSDLTGPELEKVKTEMMALGVEMGQSSVNLLETAAAAAQVGVQGASNITTFTKTMSELAIATDLTAEEAAMSMANLSNALGQPVEAVRPLASAIVALGNTTAATEPKIIDITQRMAVAGTEFGLTGDQIAALGATLVAAGVRVESGGTAMSRTFMEMKKAIHGGGKELDLFAKAAGMTAEQLYVAYSEDALGAFMQFADGLSKTKEQGADFFAFLEKAGIDGTRLIETVGTLTTNVGKLETNLETSSADAKEFADSLGEEVAKRLDETNTKVSRLNVQFENLKIKMGDELMPEVDKGATVLSAFMAAAADDRSMGVWAEGLDRAKNLMLIAVPAITSMGVAAAGMGAANLKAAEETAMVEEVMDLLGDTALDLYGSTEKLDTSIKKLAVKSLPEAKKSTNDWNVALEDLMTDTEYFDAQLRRQAEEFKKLEEAKQKDIKTTEETTKRSQQATDMFNRMGGEAMLMADAITQAGMAGESMGMGVAAGAAKGIQSLEDLSAHAQEVAIILSATFQQNIAGEGFKVDQAAIAGDLKRLKGFEESDLYNVKDTASSAMAAAKRGDIQALQALMDNLRQQMKHMEKFGGARVFGGDALKYKKWAGESSTLAGVLEGLISDLEDQKAALGDDLVTTPKPPPSDASSEAQAARETEQTELLREISRGLGELSRQPIQVSAEVDGMALMKFVNERIDRNDTPP